MNARNRIIAGLGLALAVGLLGPTLAAVATHTGNGQSTIRGKVTDEAGHPIAGICVSAHHRSYGPWDMYETDLLSPGAAATTTLADGTYTIPGLTNDNWRVKFEECHGEIHERTYRTEWYDDQLTSVTAKLVEIRYNSHAYNIDAVLSPIL